MTYYYIEFGTAQKNDMSFGTRFFAATIVTPYRAMADMVLTSLPYIYLFLSPSTSSSTWWRLDFGLARLVVIIDVKTVRGAEL